MRRLNVAQSHWDPFPDETCLGLPIRFVKLHWVGLRDPCKYNPIMYGIIVNTSIGGSFSWGKCM